MKKAKKKGTPSAKTLRGRRSAPSKKPFRLEVGKTYENRAKTVRVKITTDLGGDYAYPFFRIRGDLKKGKRVWSAYGTSWHVSGVFHDPATIKNPETWRDLVREAPPPKSPKGRGK